MEPTEGTGIVTEWPIAEGSLTANGVEHPVETTPVAEPEIDLTGRHGPARNRRGSPRARRRYGDPSTRHSEPFIRTSATRQLAEEQLAAQEAAVREIVDRVLAEVAPPPPPVAETPAATRGAETPVAEPPTPPQP